MDNFHSIKFKRQRRFLMLAPLLVLPFVTLFFWAVGGGKPDKKVSAASQQKGFNLHLPEAHLKSDKGVDKMAYYNQAAVDTIKGIGAQNPPFSGVPDSGMSAWHANSRQQPFTGVSPAYRDPNEAKVYQKLDELNRALNKAGGETAIRQMPAPVQTVPSGDAEIGSADINRLEKMMQAMQNSGDSDQAMSQLNALMDKILLAQHPERAKDTARVQKREASLPVAKAAPGFLGNIFGSDTNRAAMSHGFLGLSTAKTQPQSQQNAFRAEIPSGQTLVSGATVKLQLDEDIMIGGAMVPRGNFVYGLASLNNERLNIIIHSIRTGNDIFPVTLEAFDEDGLAGLYIPGAIIRDVAKQSADESINGVGVTTLDPSLAAQATSAGVQMAKSLFSKKIRLVRVSVPAGYRVWLKNTDHH